MACIGLGTRGGDLIKDVVEVPGVKVVAVCDVYKPHLQKGVERSGNPDVKTYTDYKELLADKNVDAVVIATPDHWHAPMVLDAVAAGKDIYCEKGFATLAEAKAMRDAIKEARSVFQLGPPGAPVHLRVAGQGSSSPRASSARSRWCARAATATRRPSRPIWRWYGYYDQYERPDPAQVASDVDWDRWLGAAPKIPFNERHFWHWRCYWNYGTGQAGDLLSHELDYVQYLLGHGIPDTCSCSG